MFPKVWTLPLIYEFCSAIQALWLYFRTLNEAFWDRFIVFWASFQVRIILSEL